LRGGKAKKTSNMYSAGAGLRETAAGVRSQQKRKKQGGVVATEKGASIPPLYRRGKNPGKKKKRKKRTAKKTGREAQPAGGLGNTGKKS